MLKIPMAAPERDEEMALARRMLGADAPGRRSSIAATVRAVFRPRNCAGARARSDGSRCERRSAAYMVDLVRADASTKASWSAPDRAPPRLWRSRPAPMRAPGRDFVTPDDVRALAGPVLEHRLMLRPEFEIEGISTAEAMQKIIDKVAVPV